MAWAGDLPAVVVAAAVADPAPHRGLVAEGDVAVAVVVANEQAAEVATDANHLTTPRPTNLTPELQC